MSPSRRYGTVGATSGALDIGCGDVGLEAILDLMPGVLFADRRLAEMICDALHRDRSDFDPYFSKIAEVGPSSADDLDCGTGTFSRRVAAGGRTVVGVDPAPTSIDVARRTGHGRSSQAWGSHGWLPQR
jgi:SAM-dependent methyltransferase